MSSDARASSRKFCESRIWWGFFDVAAVVISCCDVVSQSYVSSWVA